MTENPQSPIIGLVDFDVNELACYHKNPRRGDVDAIARSLEVNSQYRAIVVNIGTLTGRPMEVLAGNHTLAAAKQLGWKHITATTVDVDDLGAARIVAADNRTADLGGYDDEVLSSLLSEIADEAASLAGTGYTEDDLANLLDPGEPEDGDADIEQVPDQWGVVVECDTEQQQTRLLAKLMDEGYNVRALL